MWHFQAMIAKPLLFVVFMLFAVAALSADYDCVVDTPEFRKMMHDGMDGVLPQPQSRVFGPQAVAPIRIALLTEDLYNGRYCTAASGTAPDFKGDNTDCTSDDDIFTTEKRDVLLENILPEAISRVSAALSVASTTSNILVPSSTGTYWTIPSSATNPGVADADYVLVVSAGKTTGNVLAWAGYRYVDANERPIIGVANFGPAHLVWSAADTLSNEKKIRTAIHEIFHALGFMDHFIQNYYGESPGSYHTDATVRGGKPTRFITSPTVLSECRDYFGCPSLQGCELEITESSGSGGGSHWERRNHYEDLMSSVLGRSKLSRITLAFFQDSGKYTVNFGSAEATTWGKNAGCAFHTMSCGTTEGGLGTYFCDDDTNSKKECTYDKRAFGYCLTTHAVVWDYFQHFPDNFLYACLPLSWCFYGYT